MQNGSLTIGDISLNYGNGTNWNTNTSGLLLECLDNTEIAIHDSGNRVASFMQYQGGATPMFTIGRDMFWGTVPLTIANNLNISGNSLLNGTAILNNSVTCLSSLNVNSNLKIYNGKVNVTNTNPFAVPNNYMQMVV